MVKTPGPNGGGVAMRWLTAMAVLSICAAGVVGRADAAAAPADPVAYRLSPVFDAKGLAALQVEIHFREDASGVTRLAWEKDWAGDAELWTHARDVKIEGGEAAPDGPGAWIIHAPPGAPIAVSYQVVSAYDHDPTDADSQQSKPVIRPTWFYVVGEALFARPKGRDDAPATFEWRGAPEGFGFASDLEHMAGPGRKATRPGTVDDIVESIVVGGRDLRVVERRIGGRPLRVAMIGRFGFGERAFADQVADIVKAERGFWGEGGLPFLVTLAPTTGAPGELSYGGTGRTDAFALWVDATNTPLSDLRWLLAHEYFHAWNPHAIGGMIEGPQESSEYWFSEGFTDYYAWKIMLASGQFTPADFAGRWNEMLRAYAASPVRAAPNSLVVSDFWKSLEVEKLPYQRGAILAAILDQRARERGSSLDAVMREMLRRATAAATGAAGGPGPKRHADELFPAVYRDVVGVDPSDLVARHMIEGAPLDLPADVFGRCFQVKAMQAPAFDRGWDPEATRKAGQVVTGLRDGTPAYAAGLRNGMRIVEFVAGESGNAAVPYLMKVKPAAGPEQFVRFIPAGKDQVTEQQLELTEAAQQPKSCQR
jgi:predicted metalloprotease with PDZ domain